MSEIFVFFLKFSLTENSDSPVSDGGVHQRDPVSRGWCSQPRACCSWCIVRDASCWHRYRCQLDLMFHYSRRYGQVVWAIQYQADVRALLKQLERLRRKGAAEASLIPNHAFCPTRPSEWCFPEAVGELEDPGGLLKTGATTLASVVEGDAPVKGKQLECARPNSSRRTTSSSSTQTPTPPPQTW